MKGDSEFPTLLVVVMLLAVVIVGYRYYEYVMNRNFTTNVNTTCDSSVHSCFISDCSPEVDPGCDGVPYEKVEISAGDAPHCLLEHTCKDFSCENSQGCSITYCSDDVLDTGESCSETFVATSSVDLVTSP